MSDAASSGSGAAGQGPGDKATVNGLHDSAAPPSKPPTAKASGPVLPPRRAKKDSSGGGAANGSARGQAGSGSAPQPSQQAPEIAASAPQQPFPRSPLQGPGASSSTPGSSRLRPGQGVQAAGSSGAGAGGTGATSFMPTLPSRPAPSPSSGPVLDPDEPPDIQAVRHRIHDVRVRLIRAAHRLGYEDDNALVRQVLYRLALAEKLKAPWRRASRRPDPNMVAAREAARLDAAATSSEGAGTATASATQPLGFCVRMMLVGLAGTGKTQLIHALLGEGATSRPQGGLPWGRRDPPPGPAASPGSWAAVDPIHGATRSPCVFKGEACGIPMEILDTPGLLAAASGTAHNARVLRELRSSLRAFKPDLVVYVDRLDAGGAARWAGELPALKGLSSALGPATWLNTIVALTHAGSAPPMGPRGAALPWDQWVSQRSHGLQQVIRAAAGDNRLMNPTAWVESHPSARRDASGAPLMYNGTPWRPHFLLMVVSAKLLADTEAALQMQEGGGAGAVSGAADAQHLLNQMMMGGQPRTLPLPYMVTQATQFSQPLQYPDHEQVMAVARADAAVAAATDPRQRKQLVRQSKAMRLQIKQGAAYKEKMARSFRMATLAGCKITPEPPKLATKRPPSAHPPSTYRYRVPEPSGGWVVRPSLEPHGMDNGDGIEGLQAEQYTVVGRGGARPPQPKRRRGRKGGAGQSSTSAAEAGAEAVRLGGVPVHHALSAQAAKGQVSIQGRSEATVYHDSLGNTTTSLSTDVQATSLAGGPLDALVCLRADVRRKGLPLLGNGHRATAGLLLARLAEGGRLHTGPVALGGRLQHSLKAVVGGGRRGRGGRGPLLRSGGLALPVAAPSPGVPLELSAAAAVMVAPWGSTSQTTAASLAALGGTAPASVEPEACIGANLELTTDAGPLWGAGRGAPLGVNANLLSYKGDLMAGLGASLQLQGARRDALGLRLQASNKGKAGVNIKARSGPLWWVGLLAMAVPVTNLLLEVFGKAGRP